MQMPKQHILRSTRPRTSLANQANSCLLLTQRPHELNLTFHILPAAYVRLYPLSNLTPHLSTGKRDFMLLDQF